MRIISRLNPVGGIQDFWSEFRRPNPYRWPILGVSCLLTLGLLYGIISQKDYKEPVKPTISWITTYAPGRTDAEIEASNIQNQEIQDKLREALAASEERKREIYREIGRATGLDVDKMEAEARAAQAEEDAAAQREHEELMGRIVEPDSK